MQEYTKKSLMKNKLEELRNICSSMGIQFADDSTKSELSDLILAEEERIRQEASQNNQADQSSGSGSGSSAGSAESKQSGSHHPAAVVYTLPEACKRVIDTDGTVYSREEAVKNQELLAKLKKLGHKGVKIKK